MAQKVATACKMKCDNRKADNKRQAFINTDTRRFKIQTGDMGPPHWQGLCTHWTQCGVSWCWGIHCWFTFVLWCTCGCIVLCLYYLWHCSRASTNSHLSTVHTFTLVSTSLQWPLFCVPKMAIVESGSTVYQIIGDCKCPRHQKTTTQFSSEH